MATAQQREAFIQAATPLAVSVSQQTGIDPRVVLAQAALESNYGTAAPQNNYFGIKGSGQSLATSEFINGKEVPIKANFAAYPDMAASFQGYANLMNSGYYAPVRNAQGLDAQVAALGKSGYATEPDYASLVGGIARDIPIPPANVGGGTQVASAPLPPLPTQRPTDSASASAPFLYGNNGLIGGLNLQPQTASYNPLQGFSPSTNLAFGNGSVSPTPSPAPTAAPAPTPQLPETALVDPFRTTPYEATQIPAGPFGSERLAQALLSGDPQAIQAAQDQVKNTVLSQAGIFGAGAAQQQVIQYLTQTLPNVAPGALRDPINNVINGPEFANLPADQQQLIRDAQGNLPPAPVPRPNLRPGEGSSSSPPLVAQNTPPPDGIQLASLPSSSGNTASPTASPSFQWPDLGSLGQNALTALGAFLPGLPGVPLGTQSSTYPPPPSTAQTSTATDALRQQLLQMQPPAGGQPLTPQQSTAATNALSSMGAFGWDPLHGPQAISNIQNDPALASAWAAGGPAGTPYQPQDTQSAVNASNPDPINSFPWSTDAPLPLADFGGGGTTPVNYPITGQTLSPSAPAAASSYGSYSSPSKPQDQFGFTNTAPASTQAMQTATYHAPATQSLYGYGAPLSSSAFTSGLKPPSGFSSTLGPLLNGIPQIPKNAGFGSFGLPPPMPQMRPQVAATAPRPQVTTALAAEPAQPDPMQAPALAGPPMPAAFTTAGFTPNEAALALANNYPLDANGNFVSGNPQWVNSDQYLPDDNGWQSSGNTYSVFG